MSGFFLSPRIAWGTGALEQLSGLGSTRAFVLVDPTVARADGHRRVVEELEKSDTATTVELASETPQEVSAVERLFEALRSTPPDTLIAVGGGRTMDAVKALRFRLGHPDLRLTALPPLLDPPAGSARRPPGRPTSAASTEYRSRSPTDRSSPTGPSSTRPSRPPFPSIECWTGPPRH
jgi:hypothetical protein